MNSSRHPKKRRIQNKYNDILEKHIETYPALKGEIFALPGTWGPKQYVEKFLQGIATKVHCAEIDQTMFKQARKDLGNLIESGQVTFIDNDIFALITDRFCGATASPYRGADLDFCGVYTDDLEMQIEGVVDDFLLADIPVFWLRVTTSFNRYHGMANANKQLDSMKRSINNHPFARILDWSTDTYADTSPMLVTQCVVEKTKNVVKKTFEELSETERLMVEVLLYDLTNMREVKENPGYSEEDIIYKFGIRRESLGAFKANINR